MQFNDRIRDVANVKEMLENGGKGRRRRDRTKHKQLMKQYGMKVPKGWR